MPCITAPTNTLGGKRTKKTAVTHALTEYIQRRKQRAIMDLFGKIDMLPAAGMRRQRHLPSFWK